MDCNTGLARFHDNPVILRKAADYIECDGFQKNENEQLYQSV
jgi:hypothetical protein